MAKWMRPSEEMPKVWVGDRILCIVAERDKVGSPLKARLVVLEATEDGWKSPDPTYSGYTVEDAVLWSPEDSVTAIARNICDEVAWGSRE